MATGTAAVAPAAHSSWMSVAASLGCAARDIFCCAVAYLRGGGGAHEIEGARGCDGRGAGMRSEGLEGVVVVFALKGLEGRVRGVRAARACIGRACSGARRCVGCQCRMAGRCPLLVGGWVASAHFERGISRASASSSTSMRSAETAPALVGVGVRWR